MRARSEWPLPRIMCILMGLAFLYGAGYAAYHSGVEWGIFQSGCQSVDLDPTQPLSLEGPIVVGKCDEPPLVVMGVTMANMNAIAVMLLSIASFVSAFRNAKN